MHLSLALLVLLFSLILSNVINRIFPRLPLPLIQIIFGVGIGFLLKGEVFELETELFLAFIIAPLLFREGEESDITSILRNWKLILFLIFPVIFVSTLGIGYLAKAVLPASVPLSACLASVPLLVQRILLPIPLSPNASVFQSGLAIFCRERVC